MRTHKVWKMLTRVHQTFCSHGHTVKRNAPGRLFVECLDCGWQTSGVRIEWPADELTRRVVALRVAVIVFVFAISGRAWAQDDRSPAEMASGFYGMHSTISSAALDTDVNLYISDGTPSGFVLIPPDQLSALSDEIKSYQNEIERLRGQLAAVNKLAFEAATDYASCYKSKAAK